MSEEVADNPQVEVLDAAPQEGVTTAVAEYTKTAAGLAELQRKYGNIAWTVDTKKDEEAARAVRRELVSLRTGLDKLRKDMNTDDQARIALRNTEAKRITALIEALEEPVDEAIKAKEERIERERQERLAAEALRIQALRDSIADISNVALRAVNLSSADITKKLEMVTRIGVTDEAFAELVPVAINAKAETILRLQDLHAAAVAREAAEAKAAADAIELEQLREATRLREERDAAERLRVQREQEEAATLQKAASDAKAKRDLAAAQVVDNIRSHLRGASLSTSTDLGARISSLKGVFIPDDLMEYRAGVVGAREAVLAELTQLVDAVKVREATDVAREAETRAAREQAETTQMHMQQVQAIAHQFLVAQTGRAPYYTGANVADVEKVIAETEAWRIDAENFGDFVDLAQHTKDATLVKLRAYLGELIAERDAPPPEPEAPPASPELVQAFEDIDNLTTLAPVSADSTEAPTAPVGHFEVTAVFIDEADVAAVQADTRAAMKIGDVCALVGPGFNMTEAFVLKHLGVAADGEKRGVWYAAANVDRIYATLLARVADVADKHRGPA